MPTPNDILLNLHSHDTTKSTLTVLEFMYNHSRYIFPPGYRRIEIRVHDLSKALHLSDRTIEYALHFLRTHLYIRRIWRGYPHAKRLKYTQSAYELPFNLPHIISWRINCQTKD